MKRCPAVLMLVIGAMLAVSGLAAAQSASDYFPLAGGNWWRYAGTGIEMTFVVEETADGAFVVNTVVNDFVIQREYYVIQDGDVIALRRDFPQGSYELDPPQLFLRSPLAPGQQWAWSGEAAGQLVAMTFTVLEPEVLEIPAGTFEAVVVSIDGEADGEELHTMRWFAPGVGMLREQAQVVQGGQVFLLDVFLVDYHVE